MSNLIPTKITDKNGVTTTRHMKPGKVAAANRREIPSVVVSAEPLKQPSDAEVAALLYPDEDSDSLASQSVSVALKVIREHVPESLPLAVSLLTTGTEEGRKELRKRIDSNITSITHEVAENTPNSDRLMRNINYNLQMMAPHMLRQWWNCGNVMEESDSTDDTGVPGRLGNIINQEFRNNIPSFDATKGDDAFWRGCTAYTIVDVFPRMKDEWTDKEKMAHQREFYREAKKFIPYAGKHKDIGLVIRTAMERKTIVVSELKEIIAQGNTAPSIRDGVL